MNKLECEYFLFNYADKELKDYLYNYTVQEYDELFDFKEELKTLAINQKNEDGDELFEYIEGDYCEVIGKLHIIEADIIKNKGLIHIEFGKEKEWEVLVDSFVEEELFYLLAPVISSFILLDNDISSLETIANLKKFDLKEEEFLLAATLIKDYHARGNKIETDINNYIKEKDYLEEKSTPFVRNLKKFYENDIVDIGNEDMYKLNLTKKSTQYLS